jgi:E1A-binding protein p400
MVMSTRERFVDLLPIIRRFMFLIPKARALPPRMTIGAVTVSHEVPGRSTLAATEALARRSRSVYHEAVVRTDLSFPDRRLVQFDCGKLQMLADLLRERKAGGHRVLIFTQMTRMLDVLETFLNLHDHTYVRLDGSTKVEERQRLMDRFNRDTRIFVFILSTRSGGLGINLTGADTVVFYDSDWNPAMDAQAQDRAHRIGQTRDVHIFRLVTESTIEENILLKARQKRQLQQMSPEEGNFSMSMLQQASSLRE